MTCFRNDGILEEKMHCWLIKWYVKSVFEIETS